MLVCLCTIQLADWRFNSKVRHLRWATESQVGNNYDASCSFPLWGEGGGSQTFLSSLRMVVWRNLFMIWVLLSLPLPFTFNYWYLQIMWRLGFIFHHNTNDGVGYICMREQIVTPSIHLHAKNKVRAILFYCKQYICCRYGCIVKSCCKYL